MTLIINISTNLIHLYPISVLPPGGMCYCTGKYNIKLEGRLVRAFCNRWETGDVSEWCYIDGGTMEAATCPGAVKSTLGDFYWSNHKCTCRGNKNCLDCSEISL